MGEPVKQVLIPQNGCGYTCLTRCNGAHRQQGLCVYSGKNAATQENQYVKHNSTLKCHVEGLETYDEHATGMQGCLKEIEVNECSKKSKIMSVQKIKRIVG